MKIDIYNTDKKYQIIYADPPWQFGGSGGTKWRPASEYYDTMAYGNLLELPIRRIVDKNNCLLFLWVVSPEIPSCIQVGTSWIGGKYITVAFVWHKKRANVGNYTMPGCELCLLFKSGKIPNDRVRNPGQKQFYEESVLFHSKKPDEFRKRIEKMYPISNKIELFARQEYTGWDCWGNEV